MNKILDFLAAMVLVTGAGAVQAMPITVDGRIWLQPVDFVGVSWDAMVGACDVTTGECNGSLGALNTLVTGYTWASVDDVNDLFNYFLSNAGSTLTMDGGAAIEVGTWADNFFDLFTPTKETSAQIDSLAWLRTASSLGSEYASMARVRNQIPASDLDYFLTSGDFPKEGQPSPIGMWLYKGVPTPATFALLGIGLAGLGWSRRKTA